MKADRFGLLGTVLDGRYTVEAVVGEGGFGVVYRAMHIHFKEPFALKVLKIPHGLTADQHNVLIQSFESEAKHLRKFSSQHPAFVRAVDIGQFPCTDGSTAPYLVLEWLDGEPLSAMLTRRRKSKQRHLHLAEALTLLSPIAAALAVAHDHKVAHRDVKPQNIFLAQTEAGVAAKLLDLGVAKVMTETGTGALAAPTQGPTLGFSPEYAAPEQWNKKLGATGPWSDVYAFTLVLVELLTGRRALEGDSQAELMLATLDASDRPTARSRGATVSDAVEAVLTKALSLRAADRYRSMSAMWSALTAAADSNPFAQGLTEFGAPLGTAGFTEPMPTIEARTTPRIAVLPARHRPNLRERISSVLRGQRRTALVAALSLALVSAAVLKFSLSSRQGSSSGVSVDGTSSLAQTATSSDSSSSPPQRGAQDRSTASTISSEAPKIMAPTSSTFSSAARADAKSSASATSESTPLSSPTLTLSATPSPSIIKSGPVQCSAQGGYCGTGSSCCPGLTCDYFHRCYPPAPKPKPKPTSDDVY